MCLILEAHVRGVESKDRSVHEHHSNLLKRSLSDELLSNRFFLELESLIQTENGSIVIISFTQICGNVVPPRNIFVFFPLGLALDCAVVLLILCVRKALNSCEFSSTLRLLTHSSIFVRRNVFPNAWKLTILLSSMCVQFRICSSRSFQLRTAKGGRECTGEAVQEAVLSAENSFDSHSVACPLVLALTLSLKCWQSS